MYRSDAEIKKEFESFNTIDFFEEQERIKKEIREKEHTYRLLKAKEYVAHEKARIRKEFGEHLSEELVEFLVYLRIKKIK
jgi:hypothetical protein